MPPLAALRARWQRALSAPENVDASTLKARAASVGSVPIADVATGEPCLLTGVLSSVTVHPMGSTHGLEAELSDGTGHVRLVWIGRRSIEGITPGRMVTVKGRLVPGRAMSTLFNPRYSLWPQGGRR